MGQLRVRKKILTFIFFFSDTISFLILFQVSDMPQFSSALKNIYLTVQIFWWWIPWVFAWWESLYIILHFRIILLSFILMSLKLFYFKYLFYSLLLLIVQLTTYYTFKNFSHIWDYVSIFFYLWLSVWKFLLTHVWTPWYFMHICWAC